MSTVHRFSANMAVLPSAGTRVMPSTLPHRGRRSQGRTSRRCRPSALTRVRVAREPCGRPASGGGQHGTQRTGRVVTLRPDGSTMVDLRGAPCRVRLALITSAGTRVSVGDWLLVQLNLAVALAGAG